MCHETPNAMPALAWDLVEVIYDSDTLQGASKAGRQLLLEGANRSLVDEDASFSDVLKSLPFKKVKLQAKLNPLELEGTKPDVGQEDALENGSSPVKMNGSGSKEGEELPGSQLVLYPPEKLRMSWDDCTFPDTGAKVTQPGAGLYNPSTMCYMNSALQCLTYTVPLVNYLMSHEHKRSCRSVGVFCILCEMTNHVHTCLKNSFKVIRPTVLHAKLKSICQHMSPGKQEDAQEYMHFLIDAMQKAFLKGYPKVDERTAETSVIYQIFAGTLRSQVECCRCHTKSTRNDMMMELNLDIKHCYTLRDALEKFIQPDVLEEDNAYNCEKCRHSVRAVKTASILRAPTVLTIMLKRFGETFRGCTKLTKNIKIDSQFDLRKYMSNKKGEPVIYKLYAALIHTGGNLNGGHYYSFCKCPDRRWYRFDDCSVSKATLESVLTNGQAYILLYQRETNVKHLNGPILTKDPINNFLNHQKLKMVNGFRTDLCSHECSPGTAKKHHLSGVKSKLQPQPVAEVVGKAAVHQPPQPTYKAGPLPEKRDKVSFGIRPPANKSATSTSSSQDKARIILQIKQGKVDEGASGSSARSGSRVVERSADGQSTVVQTKASSMPSGLVPYGEDSDSDQENKENGRAPGLGLSPAPSSSSSPVLDKKLNATTSVPGNSNLLESRGGVHTFDSATHTKLADHRGKRSQSCERALGKAWCRHSGSSSAGNSPHKDLSPAHPSSSRKASNASKLRRSLSDSSESVLPDLWLNVNATSPWRIEGKSAKGSPPSSPSASQLASVNSTHDGWQVDEDMHEGSAAACHNGGQSLFNGEVEGGDVSFSGKHHLKKSGHVSHHHLQPSAGGDDRGSLTNGPSKTADESRGGRGRTTPNGVCNGEDHDASPDFHKTSHHSLKDSNVPSGSESHSSTRASIYEGLSPVAVSDKRPLLEDSESSPSKMKKHKKAKKHKRHRSYEEGEEGSSEWHSGHKKHKKKKKHKHKEHRDRERSDGEHHHSLHNGLDYQSDSSHRGRKTCPSSESDEYVWVEKTKDSLSSSKLSDSDQKQGSAQSWKAKCPPSGEVRKPSKEDSLGVIDELERNSNCGYGKPVCSWGGGPSSLSQEKEHHSSRKRQWSDDYEDELDRGKMKKFRKHHNEKSSHGRSFNPFQRALEERVRGDKSTSAGGAGKLISLPEEVALTVLSSTSTRIAIAPAPFPATPATTARATAPPLTPQSATAFHTSQEAPSMDATPAPPSSSATHGRTLDVITEASSSLVPIISRQEEDWPGWSVEAAMGGDRTNSDLVLCSVSQAAHRGMRL